MSQPAPAIRKTNVDATSWDPYPLPRETLVEGDPAALVHWLHASGEGEPGYYAGLWTAEVSTFDYTFPMNESAHILEGHVIVSQEGGPTVDLRAGDLAYFPRGAVTRWQVKLRLKKFFVDTP
jgi:uncharacterized cupin superfamily protein